MTSEADTPTCSARGCREAAAWMLLWRNPRLHTPDRVKRWAACETHLESLRSFLTDRGFPCETEAVPQGGAMG
ncbi:hypothetical protein AB0B28_22530 [Glycomyces sp. NPDC046736]|uniref:hypothetical protein n=1 Tax=Glycomyces sp. NPDC046736 TaxID=3155615 RepID=UPI0034014619